MNKDFNHGEGYDFYDFGDDPDLQDSPSLDELLRDVKAQLGEDEAQDYLYDTAASRNPYGAVDEYGRQAPKPQPEPAFEPDFGDAFQDYGSYAQER